MIPMGLMFGKRPWTNELHDAEGATWNSRHVCGQPRPLPYGYMPNARELLCSHLAWGLCPTGMTAGEAPPGPKVSL